MKKSLCVMLLALAAGTLFTGCQTSGSTSKVKSNDTMQLAVVKGNTARVIELLNAGASPEETDDYGETLLSKAARSGHGEVAAILLLAGAEPNTEDIYGESPFYASLSNGHDGVAALLIAAGASSSEPNTGKFVLPSHEERQKMEAIYQQLKPFRENLSEASLYFTYLLFPTRERQGNETWTDFVARSTDERLDQWLELADMKFPDEVPVPETPPGIRLVQEEWESNREFEERVRLAQEDRETKVNTLQNTYRLGVEARNGAIVALKQLQGQRMLALPDYRSAFALFTIKNLFPELTFNDASFDQKTEELYLNGVGAKGNSLGRFVLDKTDQSLRKAAMTSPGSLKLAIEPFADKTGGFGVEAVKVSFQGKTQTALPTQVSAGTQTLLSAFIDTGKMTTLPQEQSLAFIDPNAVGIMQYKDGSTGIIGYDDDLTPRITALKPVPPNNSKWAFIIGAEQYLSTDNIAYAGRSAQLFALAAKTILGVPEKHLVTLYNDEATSGSIKGSLKKLVTEGLKKGDTLYFYYNGHGVPNPAQDNTPHMLPTDMDLDYISEEPFYDIRNIYTLLANSPAKEVLVFMDSCFTGKTDGRTIYKGKAATRLAPMKVNIPEEGKMAVITAGTDTQFSSAYPEKGHRLFSYYLIEALASGGIKTVQHLYETVAKQVAETAQSIGGPLSFQNPTLQGNGELEL